MQLAKKKEEEATQLVKKKEQFMKLIEEEEKALENSILLTICRTILNKGSIPFKNFMDIIGGFDEAHRVLKGLMFVLDSKDQKVTFQSIITRRRLTEKLASIDDENKCGLTRQNNNWSILIVNALFDSLFPLEQFRIWKHSSRYRQDEYQMT